MDLETLISLGGLGISVVSVGGSIIAGVIFFGRLFQRVDEHDAELTEVKERLDSVEAAAAQMGQLAQAIEHLGQRVAGEIKHLVESMSQQNEHVKEQLGDIKKDVRAIRAPRRQTDA